MNVLNRRTLIKRSVLGWATAGGLGMAGLSSGAFSTTAVAADPSARWPYEWQVDDFFLHSDFDLRPRQAMIAELRRLRASLAQDLGIRIERELIHLILFSSESNYRGYLREYFPDIPERRALFIKRRGPGMVFAYDHREMEIDLRHEATHALLNASLAYVPLWMDEGLAEYYEVAADQRTKTSDHMKMTRFRALIGQVREVSELEDVRDLSHMGGGEYRDAWSWIHFLMNESDGSRAVLTRFLQDIQAGSPPGSFSRRLAGSMPDYRARYLRHFRA